MKDDFFGRDASCGGDADCGRGAARDPIPLGALLALVLGSLASAVLTVGTAATFLMALMLTAGEARAAQPGERAVAAPAAQGASAATAARAAQTAPTRKTDARRPDPALVARGRYLVQTAGCNDCHTPGYAEAGGMVPEQAWLTGDRLGWRGPWGTTYASNLRLLMQALSEDEWMTLARNVQYRPPMPWFALRDMSDHDLRALYRFVRHMGPAGEPAPTYVPPDQEPQGPYVQFPAPPPQ